MSVSGTLWNTHRPQKGVRPRAQPLGGLRPPWSPAPPPLSVPEGQKPRPWATTTAEPMAPQGGSAITFRLLLSLLLFTACKTMANGQLSLLKSYRNWPYLPFFHILLTPVVWAMICMVAKRPHAGDITVSTCKQQQQQQ